MFLSRTTVVALLAIERAKSTGVFEVAGAGARLELMIEKGAPVFATFSGEADAAYSIGEVLIARQAIDVVAYAKALQRNPPVAPIGEWLVRSGSTSQRQLEDALAEQMVARVARGLNMRNTTTDFIANKRAARFTRVEGVTIADLLVSAVRRLLPPAPLRGAPARLSLTRVGRELVKTLSVSDEARGVITLLSRAPAELSVLRSSITADAEGTLAALIAVGAVGTATTAPYRLLLRKHREVQRSVGPQVLLELPRGADRGEARRALRRLAKELHPDRFSQHDEAVQRTSREVMRALLDAEARW